MDQNDQIKSKQRPSKNVGEKIIYIKNTFPSIFSHPMVQQGVFFFAPQHQKMRTPDADNFRNTPEHLHSA